MKALITGSSGFVGRHLTAALTGHQVTLVDIAPARHDPAPHATVRRVDARWFFAHDNTRFDLVLHCAATVGGRTMIDGRPALVATDDLTLDAAMFDWALRTQPGRVVYFSSSAAYPTALQTVGTGHRLHEDDIDLNAVRSPDASYGWCKLTGEQLARWARAEGLAVTVVRPFTGYGTDQALDYPFPTFAARALAGAGDPTHRFTVWGDGTQTRDFIHIDDVVDATLKLADAGVDGPVNLGTGTATSFDELATMMMRAAGYTHQITHEPARPTGVHYRVANPSLLHNHHTPTVTLEEGITRALAGEM